MPPKRKAAQADLVLTDPASSVSGKRARKNVATTAAATRPKREQIIKTQSPAAKPVVKKVAPIKAKAEKTNKASTLVQTKKATASSPASRKETAVTKPEKSRQRPVARKAAASTVAAAIIETSDVITRAEDLVTDGVYDEEEKSYWLMKAEPDSRMEKGKDVKFSIDDLEAKTEPEAWDGVRNPTARNNMRAMKKGDLAFFYHSNTKVPGIAGIMKIVQEHSVDESAFDKDHPYFDAKSTRDKPKWLVVHVEFVIKFPEIVKLHSLQKFGQQGGQLANLQTLKQSRLSVSKVSPKEWSFILGLSGVEDDLLEGTINTGIKNVNGVDHGNKDAISSTVVKDTLTFATIQPGS